VSTAKISYRARNYISYRSTLPNLIFSPNFNTSSLIKSSIFFEGSFINSCSKSFSVPIAATCKQKSLAILVNSSFLATKSVSHRSSTITPIFPVEWV